MEEKSKKKMIEVTQEKVGKGSTTTKGKTSDHGSFISQSVEVNAHAQPLRSVSPQENSRIGRRKKIFDGQRPSVSPSNRTNPNNES